VAVARLTKHLVRKFESLGPPRQAKLAVSVRLENPFDTATRKSGTPEEHVEERPDEFAFSSGASIAPQGLP